MEPWHLWHLAMAHAELGQPDDARRCIEDAIDKVLRNRGFGTLAVTILPVPLARRAAATAGARRAIDSAPFLSLVTGRVSRSW
jgi:hypothetical protein